MSTVRISQSSRFGAVSPGSGGESDKTEAPPGSAGFAIVLGAAALTQKGQATAPLGTRTNDAVDGGGTTRKRTDGDGKASDAAAILAAQASLPMVIAQIAVPSHDVVAAGSAPAIISGAGMKSPVMPGAAQPDTNIAASSNTPVDNTVRVSFYPGGGAIGGARLKLADNAPPVASAADGPVPGPALTETAVGALGVTGSLGPELPAAPSLNPSPAAPSTLADIAHAIPPAIAGQPSAGSGDATSGGEARGRFAPDTPASERTPSAEAEALGVPHEVPALAAAPAATASTVAGADAAAGALGTVSDQVVSHVVRLVSSGSREMVMRLHPPELGEVMVRVAVNGRDVSAWFGSPQLHVQTAIADGIGQLQAGLGNAGYNLGGAWVGADASTDRQQAGNLPPRATAPAAARGLDVGTAVPSRPSTLGLNIYV